VLNPSGALRVGVVGLGEIGQQVAAGIQAGRGGNAEVVAVLTRHVQQTPGRAASVTSLEALLEYAPSVVVEAASPTLLAAIVLPVVESGATLIGASAAGLFDSGLRAQVVEACARRGGRVYLPSGAVGGLDTLAAAACGELDDVTLRISETRATASHAALVFSGDAVEGIQLVPGRLNVAAATRLVAQRAVHLELQELPADAERTIELTASGSFGELQVTLRPRPTRERLSHIVALSLLSAVRRLQQAIVIG
jgi:aspartate dehydrogenase